MTDKELIKEWEQKYFDLVWYARKPPKDHPEWGSWSSSISAAAKNAMAQVEEKYPDEVDALKSDSGDWEHGFNSGMLACLRLVMTAQNRELITDPAACDDGQPFWYDGVEQAIEEFPSLDT